MPTHLLIIGGTPADRQRTALHQEESIARPAAVVTLDATALPFVRAARSRLPIEAPRLVRIAEIHQAFPDTQASGTRLILTQSTYLLQRWLDTLAEDDRIVATADRESLERAAPETLRQQGPWRSFRIVDIESPVAERTAPPIDRSGTTHSTAALSIVEGLLARAYRTPSSEERLRLCREAVASGPDSAVASLALASVCRERQDLGGARAALDSALRLAPDWEAVHYENGKFWLGCENLIEAREAFQRAAERMPNFSAALSNLGATLGELGEPDAALIVFERAAAVDPENFTILNNIGVVSRELGHLAESEAACRKVIQLAPGFVFGYYNLGHTLFLAGRFPESLAAYEAGQQRDPERNRRQACRLAIARFATGDVAGAERDLWRSADAAPPDERDDLLLEAFEISQAVMQAKPELAVHQAFITRIAAGIRGA